MTIQRLEDMQRELVTLSDASHVPIEAAEVLSEDGVLVSGASGHKLESARLTILGSVRGVDTGAGAALRWDEPQAIRWIPEQTSAKEWWGIVMKQTRGYDALGRDRITFAVLQDPGHALLHSRVVGLKGPETAAVGAFGDDVAKALVTSSFTGAVAGVSLVWDHAGTLAVDADTSDAGQLTVATEWEDRWLDEVIDELADEYGFDWELRPSVTPGGIVWTFSTSAPRGGIDRTSGANRVVIDGFAGSAPEGERFLDRTGAVNAWTDKAKALARTLAASVAQWGTWFGVSGSEDTEGLDIDLELSREQDGSSWTFVAHALGGACEWMTDFGIGDLVLKANAKTGELAAPAVIEALEWSWRNGIFQPRLRFGDGKPTLSHKQKEKGGGKGGGRSGSGRNIPPKFEEIDDQIAPIAGLSEAGSINKWPKVDHRHKAQIHTPDAGEVGPHDDGHWVFTSDDASVTITGGGAGTGVIDFAASGMVAHDIVGAMHTVAGAQYQVVGATALNTLGLLTPTTVGAANSIVRTDANGYITATRFVLTTDHYIARSGTAFRIYSDGIIAFFPGSSRQFRMLTTGTFEIETGDLQITTAGKGIIASDNTAGKVFRADGARYVPAQLAIGDLSAQHNHSISASGTHTHSISASGTHTHSISASGTHTHSISASGTHSHTIEAVAAHTHDYGYKKDWTWETDGHSHEYWAASSLVSSTGKHSTTENGDHNHGAATGSDGDHNHGAATGSGGDHNHGAATGSDGDHNHGAATGAGGDHNHTGTTGNT